MKLVDSGVVFEPIGHKYYLNGKELKGITGMIKRQLFPDEYKDVPEAVLNKAAERGHKIHELCHLADACGIVGSETEVGNYVKLCSENGLVYEESEYIVTDGEHFASPIDKVYRDGMDSFILADIKTTYKLNEEYVRWQLSIYAYWFEKQNPGAKVSKLYAIWLRDHTATLIEVQRIDSEMVQRLLDAEIAGEQFNEFVGGAVNLPERFRQMEARISEVVEKVAYWTKLKKELSDGIKKEMVKAGEYNWKGDTVKVTRGKETIRKEFDKERFRGEHPELFDKYVKETPVAGSLTIKVL